MNIKCSYEKFHLRYSVTTQLISTVVFTMTEIVAEYFLQVLEVRWKTNLANEKGKLSFFAKLLDVCERALLC